jgi:hypothetical protein
MTRHDHLVSALTEIVELLELGNIEAAQPAMQRTVDAFAATPSAAADERVLPIFQRARDLALATHARLANELRTTATTIRAGRAYAESEP